MDGDRTGGVHAQSALRPAAAEAAAVGRLPAVEVMAGLQRLQQCHDGAAMDHQGRRALLPPGGGQTTKGRHRPPLEAVLALAARGRGDAAGVQPGLISPVVPQLLIGFHLKRPEAALPEIRDNLHRRAGVQQRRRLPAAPQGGGVHPVHRGQRPQGLPARRAQGLVRGADVPPLQVALGLAVADEVDRHFSRTPSPQRTR